MSDNLTAGMTLVPVNTLASFEVVASDADFFISVNGGIYPEACEEFSLRDGCLVFHQDDGDIVSHPMSMAVANLVGYMDSVLIVRFENGLVSQAKSLNKRQ